MAAATHQAPALITEQQAQKIASAGLVNHVRTLMELRATPKTADVDLVTKGHRFAPKKLEHFVGVTAQMNCSI